MNNTDIPFANASNIAELSKPINTVEEKWKLLPYFLRLRCLMRQVYKFSHYICIIIIIIEYFY